MKLIIVAIGVYCGLMGLIVENFGSLFEASFTISGVTVGAVFGVFLLGILYPWANHKASDF